MGTLVTLIDIIILLKNNAFKIVKELCAGDLSELYTVVILIIATKQF